MGHKEELLAAARRCLVTRGYAKTTARDLVAESGTNLASIGYHFGSKDALLAQALDDAFLEYTDKVVALAGTLDPGSTDPHHAVSTAWLAMTDLTDEFRPLLVAFVEALAQAERSDPLRTRLAAGYEEMRRRIIEAILVMVPDLPPTSPAPWRRSSSRSPTATSCSGCSTPTATPSGGELLEGARLTMTV